MANEARIKELRKEIMGQKAGAFDILHSEGTAGVTLGNALSGDSPVKNWSGSGLADFPREQVLKIAGETIVKLEGYKRYACWGCPIGCGGKMIQKDGKFPLELNDGVGHKPEYETLCMFGTNLLNTDLDSIVKVTEICNNLGMDTIAVGATIGYAIELYEKGLLTKKQTDGLELTWGNAEAIVALTDKIGKREGFGDILADGIKIAWQKLGCIGTEYAIQIDGEELPAHDPKFTPGLATVYLVTATPGRHTQGGELNTSPDFKGPPHDKYDYHGVAEQHAGLVADVEVLNAAGLCEFGYLSYPSTAIGQQLEAVTGWPYNPEEVRKTGQRIYLMRHAFNLREGINPLERNVPGRAVGNPPLTTGNVKGVVVDYKTLNREFLEYLGWDTKTTAPNQTTLRKLNMEFLAKDLK